MEGKKGGRAKEEVERIIEGGVRGGLSPSSNSVQPLKRTIRKISGEREKKERMRERGNRERGKERV